MTDEQKRLEKVLLEFIERSLNNNASEEETKIIPEVSNALIALWTTTNS